MNKKSEFTRYAQKLFVIAILFFITPCFAEDAASIVKNVDSKNRNTSSKMTMTMAINPSDGSDSREFSLISFENAEGDSSIEFTAPKTVKGMRILSRGNSSWVYFPSTGRVRKIGSSSRGGSVQGIGGDFSYDDLGGGDWEEDYSFSQISESDSAWILEGKRKNADTAYDAVKMTVEKSSYRLLTAEFALEKEGGYYKKLELSAYRNFGAFDRATKMVMTNMKKGSSTEVTMSQAEFNIEIDSKIFDSARMTQ